MLHFEKIENDKFVKGKQTYFYTTEAGERLQVDFTITAHDKNDKHGLMNLRIKSGYIPDFIPKTYSVQTYFTDSNGNCYGWYNPTVKACKGSTRLIIDFDFLLEATDENKAKILAEVEKMYNNDIKIKGV